MKLKVAAALTLPFVVLLGWCILLELRLESGSIVRIRVAGYDPRDLLSGHYIRYNLDLGDQSMCSSNETSEKCVCLVKEEESSFFRAGWSGACAIRPGNCTLFLRGRCEWSRFRAGVEQYFIPEELAPQLLTIPQGSSITLAVSPEGRAGVVSLEVGDEPILDYARRKAAETVAAQ